MDSEHRHELKKNELADFIENAPQYIKENLNYIIGILLIIIGLISWPLLSKHAAVKEINEAAETTHAIQSLDQTLGLVLQAQDPEKAGQIDLSGGDLRVAAHSLLERAGQVDKADLAALAYCKAAQALRTDLHIRTGDVSAEEISTQISQARDAYQKALKVASSVNTKAMANFGLAICAEEQTQIDEAKKLYTEMVNNAEFAVTVFPKLAQSRLDSIDDNSATFAFVPAPVEEVKPEEAPKVTPEIKLSPEPSIKAAPEAIAVPETTEVPEQK